MRIVSLSVSAFCVSLASLISAHAGIVYPDCDVEKAVKGATAEAMIGVGGRCSFKDVAENTAEELRPENGIAGKVVDATIPPKDPEPIKNTTKKILN